MIGKKVVMSLKAVQNEDGGIDAVAACETFPDIIVATIAPFLARNQAFMAKWRALIGEGVQMDIESFEKARSERN